MNKRALKIIKIILINLISSIRFVGAFLLPFIYHKYGASFTAIIVIILFLTDSIDGFLARSLKCSTFFGSIIDALSDKLLNLISFIILGLEYNIMFAPLIVEISILYTIYSTYRYGGNIQASVIGKIKTIILDICVILCFILISLKAFNLKSNFINYIINNIDNYILVLGITTLISCLIALTDYMNKNKQARKDPECMNKKYEQKNKKKTKLIFKQLFDTNYYYKHKDEPIMKQFYVQS